MSTRQARLEALKRQQEECLENQENGGLTHTVIALHYVC